MLRRFALAALTVCCWALGPGAASAQKLSGRPITIVVPFTPGTGIDIVARVIAEEFRKRWDQPVVVENKPGASGVIGTLSVARADPDGHTLLMTVNGHVINAAYFKSATYDPVKSFAPIGEIAVGSFMLAVHPKVPASTAAEFVAYVKSLSNLTPAAVYFGRSQTILLQRERIKRQTIHNRRLLHQNKAA